MGRVNMAKLRNRMLSLVADKYAVMLDSDVVMPRDAVSKMVRKLEGGAHFTWMHYAYSEEEMNQPLSAMEENPNLGCAGLNVETVRKLGGSTRGTKGTRTFGSTLN
jgi:Glycosyl transferase family 2.